MSAEIPTIALCMPIAQKIHPLNFRSYRHLDRSFLGPKGWHHLDIVGFPVDTARNELTKFVFDEKSIDYMLWIDDDMIYPADSLVRLLKHAKSFVGGLCFDRRHPFKPVIARYFHPSWGFEPDTYGWLWDYPPNEVIEVDATGGAFLLVHRSVVDDIHAKFSGGKEDWKDWWTPFPGDGRSEDLSFCKRAQQAGHKLFVDTGLKIGHVGEIIVDEAFAKRNRDFEYNSWYAPQELLIDMAATVQAKDGTVGKLQDGTKEPVASIIIPTFNQNPEFLQAAVGSALAQTVPCEVIVVDDGSHLMVASHEDAASHVGLRLPPGVRLITHDRNMGIANALNTGIAAMKTDWFAWLSSDDLFAPTKIERQLATMYATRTKCCFSGYNLTTDNHNNIVHVNTPYWHSPEEQNRVLGQVCAINGSTVMIHKSVFDTVGLFDPDFRFGQDWEFWCRAGKHFFFQPMLDRLVTRRAKGNLTERISKDDKLADIRDAEDARIRAIYGGGK